MVHKSSRSVSRSKGDYIDRSKDIEMLTIRDVPDGTTSRHLFRVVACKFPPHNIYRFQATRTTALGAVMVATTARAWCIDGGGGPWLDAEVIDENNYRRRLRAPTDAAGMPDHAALQQERHATFVGLSCGMTTSAPRCLELIRFYRRLPDDLRPKAILVGGWHAMDDPAAFLEAGADIVVHGEAEPILADLLAALRDGQPLERIPGISFRDGDAVRTTGEAWVPQAMMDRLPDPDFGLVRYAKITLYPVGRTRGCDGRCRFCRVKNSARWVSPERFLEQIVVLASKGARRFFIVDDRSEQDLAGFEHWLSGLAALRRERRLRLDLTTQNRLSLAERPDILELMRDAGVRTAAIGFESPIPEELRAMRKPLKPSRMLDWARVWKQHGFYVHMMLIFGYPLPPEARARAAASGDFDSLTAATRARAFRRFIHKARPDTLQTLLYTPLLGTEDRQFLESENRIYPFGWEYYDGTWLVFEPDKGTDPAELQREMIDLMRSFYAFPGIWRFGITSLLVHLTRIAAVTISLPVVWPLVGWGRWHRVWRDAKTRFKGHLVILAWLRTYRRRGYDEQLKALRHPPVLPATLAQ